MKKTFMLFFAFAIGVTTMAQVAINTDSSTPSAGAILHVKGDATNKDIIIEPGTGGNVGIGTTSPSEALEVNGNIELSGALMPGGGAGTSGQVLQSQGTGSTPIWADAPSSGGGGAAAGGGMLIAYMEEIGLFTPHTDNCDATEAFVALFTGATVGFCIEKDERSFYAWDLAQRVCLGLANPKRLPEPTEWMLACNNRFSLGLNDMVNGWEWVGNTLTDLGTTNGLGAAAIGNGTSCRDGQRWGLSSALYYRCVH